MFNRQARRGKRFRYCPSCVLDDIANGSGRPVPRPYVRVGWLSRAITNCTRHGRPMIEVPISSRTKSSFCRFVSDNMAAIELQATECVQTSFIAVDSYAEDRIRGILREPYLDRFETHVAIDLCTHLGRFVKRHRHALSAVPRDMRSAPVREIGFFLARQGEVTIRETVTRIIDQERPEGSHKFLFRSLGRWLRSNSREPAFAELVELFQDIAERNLPFAAGEMCFVPVRRRYLHSVVSAGIEYGLHEERIVQLLQDARLIEDATLSRGRIYFDAEKAHDILDAASRTLTSREAREILGVSQIVMASFLDRGLLPRVEPRDGVRVYTRIRREDLDEFRKRIFAYVVVGWVDQSMASITRVCQRAGCETADVISALIQGKLRNVAVDPTHGTKIGALRFDLKEAVDLFARERKTLSEAAGVAVMNQRDASAYMGVKPTTIPYLIGLGLLDTATVNNPVNNRTQTAVTVASMIDFQEEHVPVSEVAAFYETHPITILDLLAKIGIRPIYDNCGNVSRFFRRSDVADAPIEIPQFKKR